VPSIRRGMPGARGVARGSHRFNERLVRRPLSQEPTFRRVHKHCDTAVRASEPDSALLRDPPSDRPPLVLAVEGALGCVDWNVMMVDTQMVPLCVPVAPAA